MKYDINFYNSRLNLKHSIIITCIRFLFNCFCVHNKRKYLPDRKFDLRMF